MTVVQVAKLIEANNLVSSQWVIFVQHFQKSFTTSVLQSKSFIKEKNVTQETKQSVHVKCINVLTKEKINKRYNGVTLHDLYFLLFNPV